MCTKSLSRYYTVYVCGGSELASLSVSWSPRPACLLTGTPPKLPGSPLPAHSLHELSHTHIHTHIPTHTESLRVGADRLSGGCSSLRRYPGYRRSGLFGFAGCGEPRRDRVLGKRLKEEKWRREEEEKVGDGVQKNECFLSLCVWKLYRVLAVLLPGGAVEGYRACRQLHGVFFFL